ncbi:MAG: sulfite exporter TauE/SafE family protein [Methyloprofundus sp.]|nr:sulfite exporter TauE/SafE family protein [Methyloprofundus sp.]
MVVISLLSLIIGILLGLLGGGGSILTVPVLVYLAELPAKDAIITSLFVVGSTSLIATITHATKKHVCWKTGAIFGSAGMLGAFSGGRLNAYIPDALLLILLALVMLVAALSMMLRKQQNILLTEQENLSFCPLELPILAILLDGFFLGLITGLVGVGGGFLLVPALIHLARLPMHAAIGTSLFIICLQSFAALMGHSAHIAIDLTLTLIISLLAIIGSFIGAKLALNFPAALLKRSFGFFVLILGGGLLYKEISLSLIGELQQLIAENQAFISGASSAIVFALLYRLWAWLHTKTNKI